MPFIASEYFQQGHRVSCLHGVLSLLGKIDCTCSVPKPRAAETHSLRLSEEDMGLAAGLICAPRLVTENLADDTVGTQLGTIVDERGFDHR